MKDESKIGCHVSISKSVDLAVDRALALGCTTFQIFTKNPRGWAAKEMHETEIKEKVKQYWLQQVDKAIKQDKKTEVTN